MSLSDKQIELFQSLFKGREDIYARRWVKDDKSGYMPAYDVDWEEFEKHKARGGTFQNYKNKKPAPLNEAVIRQHLTGKDTIGIYPLLKDNTSWFIAADFDGEMWREESLRFLRACQEFDVPAYLERSRSGNGGHVWIFFQKPYPAWKSRKIMFYLLREAGILSEFDKEASFDRLFPNQDVHSGSGFGNLIALPLNRKWMNSGNTCFLDPQSGEPFEDQWKTLKEIERIGPSGLDQIYQSIQNSVRQTPVVKSPSSDGLELVIDNQIWLHKDTLGPTLVSFLREKLNFINSDYLIRKNLGRSTFKTERYFKLIGEENGWINIPRGFLFELIQFCMEKGISHQVADKRQKQKSVSYQSGIRLYPYQEEALEPTQKHDFGVIVAPPGSGKTIMGLELIARKRQPALILVHRKQLFDQWVDRIESFLGIPEKDIGRYSGSVKKPGKKITVGMIQTMNRAGGDQEIPDTFGTIIVDECHHVPAKTFREVITRMNSYYLYGLTATPMRKNNDEDLIYVFIGHILHEITPDYLDDSKTGTVRIHIRETDLRVPFNYQIDDYETLSRILVYDTGRNQQIARDLAEVMDHNKSVLVLTERKAHIDVLNLYLKERFETITLSGDDSKQSQHSKMRQIKAGHFQILLTTGQFFGEGIDIDRFDCLFLVYPFAFKGKLIQYIGRITRSNLLPEIYDYRDKQIDYFEKLFRKRNRFYNQIKKANQITLGF
jgi:superfamily II DNA or RNA helicase